MRKLIYIIALLFSISANAQQFKGIVYSLPDSLPLKGATVHVMEKSIQTNDEGSFILNIPNGKYQIRIDYLGYNTLQKEVVINERAPLIFYLSPAVNYLQEVEINTGYQTLPKERATGSFVTISNKVLNEQFSTDIISRLEAVANGVTVDKRANPNGGNLMIRGLSTISGPKEPLIILDNFQYQGDLENINPNDIETITILKDAAATSIWGSRAGNGVIVLTSKKAKVGQPFSIDASSNFSIADRPSLSIMQQLTPTDHLLMEQLLYDKGFYTSRINSTSKPALSPFIELLVAKNNGSISTEAYNKQLAFLQGGDIRTEFADLSYQKAIKQQYAINMRGSEHKMDWNILAGYDHNSTSLDATTTRLNLTGRNTLHITKNFKLDFGLTFTQSHNKTGRASYADLNSSGNGIYPYLRLKDENGADLPIALNYSLSYLKTLDKNTFADWGYYPLSDYQNYDNNLTTRDLLANLSLNYQILPGLRAKIYYQNEYQTSNSKSLSYYNSYVARNIVNTYTQISGTGTVTRIVPVGGILENDESILKSYSLRAQLNYDKIWSKHELNFLGGYEVNERNVESQGNKLYGYDDDRLAYVNLNYATTYPNFITKSLSLIDNGIGLSSLLNRFVSMYANLGYNFQNKYTVTASARKDASNLFGLSTNDKWKPLWSVGAAWNVTNESFIKLSWLNNLKLRASYGFSGNVDLGRSAVTTTQSLGVSAFTNGLMARFNQYSNPELRWEKVGTINIGLDFAIFKNRLSGSIEVYQKNAKDLYGSTPADFTAVPTFSLSRNVANIKANGLDISLNSLNTTGLIRWSTTLNFNLYKDEVIDYYRANDQGSQFVGNGTLTTAAKGYPVYSIFSYAWAGLDPVTGNPRGYYQGQVSSDYTALTGANTRMADLVYSGPAFPTVFGNVGNTLSYKGISLTARITYKLGYSFGRSSINYSNLFNSGVGHSDYAMRWQKQGDELTTNVPSLVYPAVARRDAFYNNSEILVEKGDHIRLAYLSLSYELKKEQLGKLPFRSVQLQGNVSNLGMIWRENKLGIDPDYRDNTILPSKYFSFGLRCTL
jgi:TonB-linked SusC/RagA family outer membrane protein